MANEDLVKWIKDMRERGYKDERITAELKKTGHKEDNIRRALQDASMLNRQSRPSTSRRAVALLVVCILIVVGVFVIWREMAPSTEPTSTLEPYYTFQNAYAEDAGPEQAAAMQAAALEFEQMVREDCPAWMECSSDLVARYVVVKLDSGSSPEEILADRALYEDMLYRKEDLREWMDNYLAYGNDSLFIYDFQRVRFSLEALNNLELLTDEEREQWIRDLSQIQPPRANVAIRRGDLVRFLGGMLNYTSFDELRALYGTDYDEAYQSVCAHLSWEDIKPASGFMVAYLYLREYCGMPLSAEEVTALEQSIDSLGTDDESVYLKSHFQRFV